MIFSILFLEIFFLVKFQRNILEYANLIKKFFAKIKNPLVENFIEKLIIKYLFKIIILFLKLIFKFLMLLTIISILYFIDDDFKLIFLEYINIFKLSVFFLIYYYIRKKLI